MKLLQFSLFILILCLPLHGYAQFIPDTQSQTQKSLTQAEIDAVVKKNPASLQEMNQVFADCQNNMYESGAQDCRCYSVKYLEQRILLGPKVPADEIAVKLDGSCANLPAIAGDFYKNCMAFNEGLLNDAGSYCTCFGNRVAKNYEKSPGSTAIHLMTLRDEATDHCQYAERRINTIRSRQ